jgi:YQGE family putative transporter
MEHFTLAHHHFKKPHYFDGKLSKGFKNLLSSRIITNVGTGFFAVFFPIFLYETLGKNLTYLAIYYFISYALSLLFSILLPPSLNKFGFKKALQTSTLIGVFYYLGVFLLNKDNIWFILPIVIFLVSLWRFLYWVPYNIDFAKFTNPKDRGKEVGFIEAMLSLIGVITPIIAGFFIISFGFNILFLVGCLIFFLSFFPLIKLPKTREKFTWSRTETIKKVFLKKNRKLALFFFLDGAETVLGIFVWPIFIYELLNGNYLEIGTIASLVVLFTMLLQLSAGRLVDKNKGKIIKTGGLLYAIGWFLKIFAITSLHVFVFDAFHQFMKVFYRIPLDTMVFETAFKQKHLIDEFNVFRQICLFLGRLAMVASVIILSLFITSISWIFILGVFVALFISVFYKKIQNALV